MKSKLLSVFLLSSSFASADAEKSIPETLQDALYAEEVKRDPETAAKHYEEILSRYQSQREFAATALFRLAEVRRKQDRKGDAIKLYQKLITEFPASEMQVALALGALTELGGKMPGTPQNVPDKETLKLAEFKKWESVSPDLLEDPQLIIDAVSSGYLKVIDYLIARKPDIDLGPALCTAAEDGSLAICEQLLKAGAKINPPGSLQPLALAASQGHSKIVAFLLSKGADINASPDPSRGVAYVQEGTALYLAVQNNHPGIVRQLIEAKADVILPKGGPSGFTPLLIAANNRNQEITKLLLDNGADADHVTGISNNTIFTFDTALLISTRAKDLPISKLLVEKSKKETIQKALDLAVQESWNEGIYLFAQASDPNGGNPLYLLSACQKGDIAMIATLLKAGADPNRKNPGEMALTPLMGSMFAEKNNVEIANILLEAGAVPDELLLNRLTERGPSNGFNEPNPAVVALLTRRFVVPQFIRRQAVTLFFTAPAGKFVELSKPRNESDDSPPDLATLLVNGDSPFEWPTLANGSDRYPMELTVWRSGEDGRENAATAIWEGSLDQQEPFPELKWGDVIELGFRSPPAGPFTGLVSKSRGLPDDISWNLRKRISFPVKIRIGENERDYTMRGDRLYFDPLKAELPLLPALQIAGLLTGRNSGYFGYDTARNSDTIDKAKVMVSRDGWPDITLNYMANSDDGGFRLKSGDRMTIPLAVSPKEDQRKFDEQKARDTRRSQVTICATGHPVVRYWKAFPTGEDENGITLTQTLAEILGNRLPESRLPEQAVAWYIRNGFQGRVLWNNPDLSDIVIRRLKSDPKNEEEIIRIDLTAAISNSENTVEAARKADVMLRAGDIVELKLRPDEEGKVWTGLSAKERDFFAKALGGRVQVRDPDQSVSVRELVYSAPEWIATEAGKLPVPAGDAGDGVPSVTIETLFGARGKIIRAGREIPEMIFVRNGDQVQLESPQVPRRRSIAPPVSVPQPPLPVK